MRPNDGLCPTRPQKPAGVRVEPPPSLAVANGTSPAETAAAEPPLDPPGVRVRSYGFRVTPVTRFEVYAQNPNSGTAVFPNGIAPARRSRPTWIASASTGPRPLYQREPLPVGIPAQSSRSLTPNGTPASGPSGRPLATSSSIDAAAASATSASRWMKALSG